MRDTNCKYCDINYENEIDEKSDSNLESYVENSLQDVNSEVYSVIWLLLKKVYWIGYKQGCLDAPFCYRKFRKDK